MPSLKRLLLLSSMSLCLVLAVVLALFSLRAPVLRLLFGPYQFFLIGACVGALFIATLVLILERNTWAHYRVYFVTVMASVFLLVVTNLLIFRVLGGDQFIRRLVEILWIVFRMR